MASYGAVEDPARTAHSPAGLQSRRCLKTTAGIAVAAMAGFVLCLVWKNAEGAAPAPRRAPPGTQALAAAAHAAGPRQPTTVYLGNGCFWARQLALVHVEQQSAAFRHRSPGAVTALAGYAGSTRTGPDGLVCYHGGPSGTVYAGLGDCEVVQVALDSGGGDGPGGEKEEFGALLQSFFASFVSLGAEGMQRPDPQDAGSQYRAAIGIPGGLNGPLMELVREKNVHGMDLVAGKGGDKDELNTVYIYDSHMFPFHRAEQYHQFYKGPEDVKAAQESLGRIAPTGCPEQGLPFSLSASTTSSSAPASLWR